MMSHKMQHKQGHIHNAYMHSSISPPIYIITLYLKIPRTYNVIVINLYHESTGLLRRDYVKSMSTDALTCITRSSAFILIDHVV